MSLYIIIGVALLLGTIVEVINRSSNNVLYTIFFVVLLGVLVFRYGQGTDYFAYHYLFNMVPKTLNIFTLIKSASQMHTEVGWQFFCALFKILGLNFYWFVAFVGIVTMLALNTFIQKYCPLKVTALLIAYPTLYLTYIVSGMRQGFVICVFLGYMLDLYLKRDKSKFFIAILLCSTIHSASFILLILLIDWVKDFILSNQYVIVAFAWVGGISLSFLGLDIRILGRNFTIDSFNISYIAALERILTYVVIQFLYSKYKKIIKDNKLLDEAMYVYIVSVILYGVFFSMPMFSSRMCYFFKSMELIICTVFMAADKEKFPEFSTMFFYIAALSMVMLFKNIESYLVQGEYYSYYNIINYPYNNLFVKGDYRYSIHQQLIS